MIEKSSVGGGRHDESGRHLEVQVSCGSRRDRHPRALSTDRAGITADRPQRQHQGGLMFGGTCRIPCRTRRGFRRIVGRAQPYFSGASASRWWIIRYTRTPVVVALDTTKSIPYGWVPAQARSIVAMAGLEGAPVGGEENPETVIALPGTARSAARTPPRSSG